MNIQKAELKLDHLRSWGEKFCKREEETRVEIQRLEGAEAVLKQAIRITDGSHKALYQRQLDNDEITQEQCEFAIRVVDRCVSGLIAMSETTRVGKITKRGELNGYLQAANMLREAHDRERKGLQDVLDAIERGDVTVEDDGRLGPSLRVMMGKDGPEARRALRDLRERRRAAMESAPPVAEESAPPVAEESAPPVAEESAPPVAEEPVPLISPEETTSAPGLVAGEEPPAATPGSAGGSTLREKLKRVKRRRKVTKAS